MKKELNMNYKCGIAAVLLCLGGMTVRAQSTSSLKINEVLTNNTENYVDQFGNRGPWIEIYNSSAGTVEMAGCYITTDVNRPKMYMISKGDLKTKIGPRQRILLWADNMPHHGAFHTNFKLDPNKENIITLFDASGKRIIDQVKVPVLPPNTSFGRVTDGSEEQTVLKVTTPEAANFVQNGNPKVEKFEEHDSTGGGMALSAMLVVFLALILLYLVFKLIGNIAVRLSSKRAIKAQGGSGDVVAREHGVSGEVLAAIGMALYEHEEGVHDWEDPVLTIRRVKRNYSPWSSKIYGLRQWPHLK